MRVQSVSQNYWQNYQQNKSKTSFGSVYFRYNNLGNLVVKVIPDVNGAITILRDVKGNQIAIDFFKSATTVTNKLIKLKSKSIKPRYIDSVRIGILKVLEDTSPLEGPTFIGGHLKNTPKAVQKLRRTILEGTPNYNKLDGSLEFVPEKKM